MKFNRPVYELKTTWTGGDVLSDICMTKKEVISEVKSLLTETDELVKIEIEIVGIIE